MIFLSQAIGKLTPWIQNSAGCDLWLLQSYGFLKSETFKITIKTDTLKGTHKIDTYTQYGSECHLPNTPREFKTQTLKMTTKTGTLKGTNKIDTYTKYGS